MKKEKDRPYARLLLAEEKLTTIKNSEPTFPPIHRLSPPFLNDICLTASPEPSYDDHTWSDLLALCRRSLCWIGNESNVKARPQQWYRKEREITTRIRGMREMNKTKIPYWLDEIRVQLTLTTLRRSINSMKSILDSLRPVSAWGGKALSLFLMMLKLTEVGSNSCGMDCVWLFLDEWSFVVRHLDFSCIFGEMLGKIADQFLDKLVKWTNNIKISDPFEEGLYSQQRTKIARQNLIFSRINPSCPQNLLTNTSPQRTFS
ncbi:hypothetical protein YC2023_101569 [Brassica napus]